MKILLVDDEILVRTKMKYILEMEIQPTTGIKSYILCGEASNGVEALEKIEKLRPDIVISDMKMPIMDGMELSRLIKANYPEISFIALSNYDDFEYVKGTLLNGASDYLLKHMLNAEYLLKTLEKTVKDKREKQSYSNLTEKNLESLRNDFAVNLLTGLYREQSILERDISLLECSISQRRVVPVLMWIHEYRKSSLENDTIQNFSILNIITELMEEQKNGIICHINDGMYVLVFGYENIKSEKKTREELTFSLNRIRFCMKKYLELEVYFIIGRIQETLLMVSEEYQKIEECYRRSFYLEKDIWLGERTYEKTQIPVPVDFSENDKKKLIYALINGNKNEVYQQLDMILGELNENKSEVIVVRTVVMKILETVKKASKECGISIEEIYKDSYSESAIFDMKSFQSVKEALGKVMESFLKSQEQRKMVGASLYMQNALAYIYEHYTEALSQAEVAEHVGISTVYLSVLFKNEMGEKFSSFLMNLRIEHATNLLKSGNNNLKQVASLSGFTDYVYFLKCFKKKNGITPKEYIRNNK